MRNFRLSVTLSFCLILLVMRRAADQALDVLIQIAEHEGQSVSVAPVWRLKRARIDGQDGGMRSSGLGKCVVYKEETMGRQFLGYLGKVR